MNAKAVLQQQLEDPIMKKLAGPNADWGKHVVYNSPHNPPPVPPTAPHNSKMVWNPKLQKYTLGIKGYNYVPDLKIWLNRQKADKLKREESARRYRNLSPTASDKRRYTRRTRYFNEKTRTYRSSRSPSRRRSHSRHSRSRRH